MNLLTHISAGVHSFAVIVNNKFCRVLFGRPYQTVVSVVFKSKLNEHINFLLRIKRSRIFNIVVFKMSSVMGFAHTLRGDLIVASINRAYYLFGVTMRWITMVAPSCVMLLAPPTRKVFLAAAFNRAYTGISQLSLLSRFGLGEKPLDGDTSSGFAISSL